jgi:hypothetical protein
MANAFKNTQKVANRLLLILKNQLVMAKLVDSRFKTDFPGASGNGEVPIGDTITIRRPPMFTVTDGATFAAQDVLVGSTQLTIDKQKHVGFTLSDFERVLKYDGDSFLKDSVVNARMNALANQVDTDLSALVAKFPGFVGTAGNAINTVAGFNAMPKRLDNMAVPQTDRNAILSVDDYWAMAGVLGAAGTLQDDINVTALKRAKLPTIGNVNAYMTQSVPVLTCGTRTNGAVNGASQSVTYAASKDTYTQSLILDGVGASKTISAGEVFTLASRYAVNPVTGEKLGYLQQFTVTEDATSDGSGNVTVTISPPIITAAPYATVDSAVADNDVVTWLGTASTAYTQNATFHKEAIKLAWVRPAKPHNGDYSYAEDPETGISLRLWAFSDGSADTHSYRADIMYGVLCGDPRLGVRGNGA